MTDSTWARKATGLYRSGGALPHGHSCYVRRPSDAQFLNHLEYNSQNLLLVGPRRFGKSSLLKACTETFAQLGRRLIQFDARDLITEGRNAFGTVLNQTFGDQLQVDVAFDISDGYYFERIYKLTTDKGFLLVIDNVDQLAKYDASGVATFFHTLRSQTDKADFCWRVVCASSVSLVRLAAITQFGEASAFDHFQDVPLDIFGVEQLRRLIDPLRDLVPGDPDPRNAEHAKFAERCLSEDVLQKVLERSGGHPEIAHRLCAELAKTLVASPDDDPSEVIGRVDPGFVGGWSFVADQAARLVPIADASIWPPAVSQEHKEDLIRDGIYLDGSDGTVKFSCELFEQYFRDRIRAGVTERRTDRARPALIGPHARALDLVKALERVIGDKELIPNRSNMNRTLKGQHCTTKLDFPVSVLLNYYRSYYSKKAKEELSDKELQQITIALELVRREREENGQ